ncbi:MAG: glycosyltransferase family 2 protein, partial [Candidatus Norongarragalinales archaeon]
MSPVDALFFLANAFFLYVTLVFLLAFLENRERALRNPKPRRFPSLSIIIPAFNEEDCIAKTMRAASRLRYPKRLEIIVVDDGSSDETLRIARETAKEIKGKASVKVIHQKNAGKAAALNTGLREAHGELVATVDADSLPHEDALLKMVGYFNDTKVAAVTASVKIHKPRSFVQLLQFVEYVSMNYLRKASAFIQGISCTPGPLSVFRASVFEKIGGFDEGNVTEDTEIALRLQKHGFRIENALDAVVESEAPYSLAGLVRQRVRWYHGALLNAGKYSSLFFNKRVGAFGWFVYPTNFIAVAFSIFVLFRLAVMLWERILFAAFGAATNAAVAAAAVAGAQAAQPTQLDSVVSVVSVVFDPRMLFTVDVLFVAVYIALVV